MKNKIKAAVSLLLSLLLALGCMGTSAFAADRNLGNVTLAFSTETGSITVVQNLNAVEQLGITGGPVAGVEYTLAQIGSLCEITYTGGYMTGYAVKQSTAQHQNHQRRGKGDLFRFALRPLPDCADRCERRRI